MFLACEYWKNLKFLRCIHIFDLVLEYCSDVNEGNGLELLFYFIVILCIVVLITGIVFSFFCVSGFRQVFSRIALLQKRLQLDSKSDLTMIGMILEFFLRIWLFSLTSYLYGLKSAKIAQL